MEESHRKVLRKFRLHISRNIDARRITEVLFTKEILDEASKESILAQTTSEGKAFCLLDELSRSGPDAFESFLNALHGSGRSFLANEINLHLSGMKIFWFYTSIKYSWTFFTKDTNTRWTNWFINLCNLFVYMAITIITSMLKYLII